MNVSRFYHNSIYNDQIDNEKKLLNLDKSDQKSNEENQHEKKELQEINNRLGNYFKLLREFTQNRTQNDSNAPHLLTSVKYLEQDLDVLRRLYENEMRNLRFVIDDLCDEKNKHSMELYTEALKVKELQQKFTQEKAINENLTKQLNEFHLKNQSLEIEFFNLKNTISVESTSKMNQKSEENDAVDELNDKMNVIAMEKDELLRKLKEIENENSFLKQIYNEEVDNLKVQLKESQTNATCLEQKLQDSSIFEANVNAIIEALKEKHQIELEKLKEELSRAHEESIVALNTKINALKNQNDELLLENQQLDKRNNSLQNLSTSLEETISSLENGKKSLRKELEAQKLKSLEGLYEMETKLNNFQNLILRNVHLIKNSQPLEGEIQLLKNLLNDEEKRLRMLMSSNDQQNDPSKNAEYLYSRIKQASPIGPINHSRLNAAKSQASINSCSSPLPKQPTPQQVSSPNPPIQLPLSHIIDSSTEKDYTAEILNNYKKSVLQNKKKIHVDEGVTEASYVGNVKIHEVNKNGYYVRLMNVSHNTDEDISSFIVEQMVSNQPVAMYRFPRDLILQAGHTVTVWSNTDEVEQQAPHTFIWREQDKWGTGPECTTILAKPNGQAVSWTTGCHKYGNVDFDDMATVYTRPPRRAVSRSHLNREKLTPSVLNKGAKHPYCHSPQSTVHPNSDKNLNAHNGSSPRPTSARKQSTKSQKQQQQHVTPLSTPYFNNNKSSTSYYNMTTDTSYTDDENDY